MLVSTLCFFESFSQTAPYKVVSFWFGFAWECEPMWTDWLVECCWIRCCLGWCGFEFLLIWFHYFPKPSLQCQLPVPRWTFGPFLHHGVISQSFRKNKNKNIYRAWTMQPKYFPPQQSTLYRKLVQFMNGWCHTLSKQVSPNWYTMTWGILHVYYMKFWLHTCSPV